jgi:NedA-like, galactose-binding domain
VGDAVVRPSLESVRATFLLGDAERLAASYLDLGRQRMRPLVRAAQDRAAVAERLLEHHAASALTLYREAALLTMAAAVTASSAEPLAEPLDAAEVVTRFRAVPHRSPPGDLAAFLAFVSRPSASLESRPSFDVERARANVRWLRAQVEPRGVAELRFVRAFRLSTATVLVAAVLAWALSGLGERRNVALHKPVTTSGVHPNAVSPPSGLTDGVIVGPPYGVHTSVGDAPWVQVDLLSVYTIDKIKVYNRGDGWLDDCLPLTLQLSENGSTFVDVETRTAAFGQQAPWIAKAKGKRARYVRIRAVRGKYVTLSELEVFGR